MGQEEIVKAEINEMNRKTLDAGLPSIGGPGVSPVPPQA
jgi:hypothetical protein